MTWRYENDTSAIVKRISNPSISAKPEPKNSTDYVLYDL